MEVGRQHTRDLVFVAIQLERATDGARIGAEHLLPEAVTRNDRGRRVCRILRTIKVAKIRPHAEQTEVIAHRAQRGDTLRLALSREVRAPVCVRRRGHEQILALREVDHLTRGQFRAEQVERKQVLIDHDELVQRRRRHRMHQHRVHQTEDRGVRTDTEGEGEDDDRRIERAPSHAPERVADVEDNRRAPLAQRLASPCRAVDRLDLRFDALEVAEPLARSAFSLAPR